jgi:hypothetical protein
MRLRFFYPLTVLGALACASAGPTDGDAGGAIVQATVVNEYVATITVYAVWGSTRTRLGEVGANRQRVFFTPVRGDRLAIGFEAIGAPPAGTGDPRQEQYAQTEGVTVISGDEVECTLAPPLGGCAHSR